MMTDWGHILTVVDTILLILAIGAGWGFGMAWLVRFIRDY
jgi:hypothetical protein